MVQETSSPYFLIKATAMPSRSRPLLPERESTRQLRRLERQADLDSLACLLALMERAASEGDHRWAFKVSQALCRTLLVMGPWLYAHGIAMPLGDYFEQLLLPIGTHVDRCHRFSCGGFLNAVRRLARTAMSIEADENRQFSPTERVELMLDLLDDKFSVDLSALIDSVPAGQTLRSPCR